MRFKLVVFAALAMGLVLSGCDRVPEAGGEGMLFTFLEHEPGVEPFRTRVIVTASHMRLDDGHGVEDFVLFDRRSQAIYSVNALDRNIMVIQPKEVTAEPPFPLEIDEQQRATEGRPEVAGDERLERYEFTANGERCNEVVVVPGMFPDATQAMRDYRNVLAGLHASLLEHMPAEMQAPCDLANHIFAPDQHLQHGFPVWEEEASGRGRQLLAYESFTADAALFQLPEGYGQFSLID